MIAEWLGLLAIGAASAVPIRGETAGGDAIAAIVEGEPIALYGDEPPAAAVPESASTHVPREVSRGVDASSQDLASAACLPLGWQFHSPIRLPNDDDGIFVSCLHPDLRMCFHRHDANVQSLDATFSDGDAAAKHHLPPPRPREVIDWEIGEDPRVFTHAGQAYILSNEGRFISVATTAAQDKVVGPRAGKMWDLQAGFWPRYDIDLRQGVGYFQVQEEPLARSRRTGARARA